MKKRVLFACLCMYSSVWAAPMARLTIKVVDEKGGPIKGASVLLTFDPLGGQSPTKVQGLTDDDGMFAGQGETHPNVSFNIVKDDYYESRGGHVFTEANEKKYRFEPWGYTNTVVLRKIIDPKTGKKGGFNGVVPKLGKKIGFDMMVGDWVAPFGKGAVSDFIFICSYDEAKKVASYTLSCPNKGDGLIELPRSSGTCSIFKWPYLAPVDGYQAIFKKKKVYSGGDTEMLPGYGEIPRGPENLRYIFRIRTQYDKQGNITSAYYGKIGNAIQMTWQKKLIFKPLQLNLWVSSGSGSSPMV